jgi:pilus assembly protein FimV
VNCGKQIGEKDRVGTPSLLSLVALGGGLISAIPASALELGDLTVESTLGQPLRASIAYALAPNEMLSDSCVTVGGGRSSADLPGIGPASVSITDRAIVIRGDSAVREPMLGTRVTINCPYTVNLSREYMLFVDPVGIDTAALATPVAATAMVARPEYEPRTQTPPVASVVPAPRNDTPIGQSTRYRVQPGDTLSGIVQRIENRSIPMWPAINAIFDANPDAFIGNDPNQLRAGSWLTIPSLDGSAPVVADPADKLSNAAPVEPGTATDAGAAGVEAAAMMQQAEPYEPVTVELAAESVAAAESAEDATRDLRPGDLVPRGMLADTAATVSIPDTELEGPQTTSSSPNVPTAIVSTGARSESTSLLTWLIGGGLAVIAALLLFGRRARRHFGPETIGPAEADRVERRREAADSAETFGDYDLDDDSPTDENPVLDADLVIGTGLDDGVEVDVAQDFGFAATTELDIELPFEPEAPAADMDTDIIPTMKRSVESILESEMLPGDDDYDMSVIMDATKMPRHEDITERDLQAVEVDTGDETTEVGGFTISNEVDYDILEQDYEDELTATQALNEEIERAAAELARDLNESVDDEETSMLPEVADRDLTATSEMPSRVENKSAGFGASYDPDDTNAVTVNMSAKDESATLAVANDDETAEMETEHGKVDSRSR